MTLKKDLLKAWVIEVWLRGTECGPWGHKLASYLAPDWLSLWRCTFTSIPGSAPNISLPQGPASLLLQACLIYFYKSNLFPELNFWCWFFMFSLCINNYLDLTIDFTCLFATIFFPSSQNHPFLFFFGNFPPHLPLVFAGIYTK